MRWNHLAVLFVVGSATACLAETPDFSSNRSPATQLFQGRLFSGQSWWNRYGEPVNATTLAEATTDTSNAATGPMPMYGDGYIYGPGSCDYSSPCISHLWNGYFQWPKRCRSHHGANGAGGYGADGCGPCGNACGPLAKLFCHGGCGACGNCSTSSSCGCTAPVTCSTACDCGCKPVCGKCHACHLGNKWRCFTAHWNCGCNSCSAPTCGCTTPTPAEVPSEKQASQGPPVPLPEEALLHPLPRLN